LTTLLTDWFEALDRFEERLARFQAVLEQDADPVPGRWPPEDLVNEPIPPELVPRARSLLAKARELELRMSASRNALQLPPAPHHRQRPFLARPTISAEL
jgi:hypothetical protein